MEVPTPIHPEDLDVSHATFARPDLTTFARLDELGLEVVGQRVEPRRAVLACRVVDPDQWCHRCGCEGTPRDTVVRRLAHEPLGWRPTILEVTVRRYRCGECGHVWRQDMTKAAEPRALLSRRALRWALEGLVVQHLTVARVAEGLAVSWDTANKTPATCSVTWGGCCVVGPTTSGTRWPNEPSTRSIPTRGNGSRRGCGRSIVGSDGQSSGVGTACPAAGGSPTTESGSRAQPASLSSGTATAVTRSRPRGPHQPSQA